MEPIKFEVSISVNVDLSQSTKDFVLRIVDARIAAQLESAEKSSTILTQLLEVLRTPIPVCGEIGPEVRPIAAEAQIELDAMHEAAKVEEAKISAEAVKKAAEEAKPEPSKEEPTAEKTISIEDVRGALTAKINDHRETIKAKLTELGAKSVTTLEPSKYQEMYNFLNSL